MNTQTATDLRAQADTLIPAIAVCDAEIADLTEQLIAAYASNLRGRALYELERERMAARKLKSDLESQVRALTLRASNVERYGAQALSWS
jgi:hypothetical protein